MNQLWHEVDAIIEFKGGDYAAFEIKLSDETSMTHRRVLLRFTNMQKRNPKRCALALDTWQP